MILFFSKCSTLIINKLKIKNILKPYNIDYLSYNDDVHLPEVSIPTHLDNGKLLHLLPAALWRTLLPRYSLPSEAEETMKVKAFRPPKSSTQKTAKVVTNICFSITNIYDVFYQLSQHHQKRPWISLFRTFVFKKSRQQKLSNKINKTSDCIMYLSSGDFFFATDLQAN